MDAETMIPVLDAPKKPPRAYNRRTARTPRTAADAHDAGVSSRNVADAGPAEPAREEQSVTRATRKTRGERQTGLFEVPAHLKKRGTDYQWWTLSIYNAPVERSVFREIAEGGWAPVQAADMPEMMAPGDNGQYIEAGGQRLYARPSHLTAEAKAEDLQAAMSQQRDRVEGALSGRAVDKDGGEALASIRGVRPVSGEASIETEIGSYRK